MGAEIKADFRVLKVFRHLSLKFHLLLLRVRTSKRDDYIGVVVDKAMIEIGEAKKFLNVIDFPRFGPVLYCLNFGWIH